MQGFCKSTHLAAINTACSLTDCKLGQVSCEPKLACVWAYLAIEFSQFCEHSLINFVLQSAKSFINMELGQIGDCK